MSHPVYSSSSSGDELPTKKRGSSTIEEGDIDVVSGPRKRTPSAKMRERFIPSSRQHLKTRQSSFSPRSKGKTSPISSQTHSKVIKSQKYQKKSDSERHSSVLPNFKLSAQDLEYMISSPTGAQRIAPSRPESEASGIRLSGICGGMVEVLPFNFSEALSCFICKGVIRQCQTMSKCSHKFCRFCIGQHLITNAECPKCRAKITAENKPTKDPYFDSILHLLSPLTQSVTEGVKQTWDSLVRQGDSISSLCLRYEVDKEAQQGSSSSLSQTTTTTTTTITTTSSTTPQQQISTTTTTTSAVPQRPVSPKQNKKKNLTPNNIKKSTTTTTTQAQPQVQASNPQSSPMRFGPPLLRLISHFVTDSSPKLVHCSSVSSVLKSEALMEFEKMGRQQSSGIKSVP